MIQIVFRAGPGTENIIMVGQINEFPNVNPNVGEKLSIGQDRFEVVSRDFSYTQQDGVTSLALLTLECKKL